MMKTFILKSLFFVLPFLMLGAFTKCFYVKSRGDLQRTGYIFDHSYDLEAIFSEDVVRPIAYKRVSEIDLNKSQSFTAITVGDSFSEQRHFSYVNYLASEDEVTVLHLDKYLHQHRGLVNPVEGVYGLLNGDLLDRISADYLILQAVERYFLSNVQNVDVGRKITIENVGKLVIAHQDTVHKRVHKEVRLFSRDVIRFPLYNIGYLVDDNAFVSKVYQVKTVAPLFTGKQNNLIFLNHDLEYTPINNDALKLHILNDVLNDLAEKLADRGIQLIVLPSPDKYDVYYDWIEDKDGYTEPLFFERFGSLPKKYIYIDSKSILQQLMGEKKDVYFYDDTHWSPWASKRIGDELNRIVGGK